jgi:hypothetical protein
MRSFVVEATHVDAILSIAIHGPADFNPRRYPGWDPPEVGELLAHGAGLLSTDNASEVGAALLDACIASVAFQRAGPPTEGAPGRWATPDPSAYEFTDLGPVLTAAEALKAIACLECQSCEHPSWRDSSARNFCGDLLWRVISTLPGYQEAPWELSADRLPARTAATGTRAA